jgi:hypothetical protein
MKGKDKCALLKSIRVRLAEVNNIPYTPHLCNNSGDCNGTCELCDTESKWLLCTMKELEDQGRPIIYSLSESDGNVFETNITINSTELDCDARRKI